MERFLEVLEEAVIDTEDLRYSKEQNYMIDEINVIKLILERSEEGLKVSIFLSHFG